MATAGDVEATRPCGLYRTEIPLPDRPDAVGAGVLVSFHNHSESGPPIVLLPEVNEHNRWRFRRRGHLVHDRAFIDALEPLKPQGLCRVREHFHPDAARVVPKNALVQLGYDRRANPLVFYPRAVEGENAIAFPSRGMRIPPSVYELLDPLDLRGPHEPTGLH